MCSIPAMWGCEADCLVTAACKTISTRHVHYAPTYSCLYSGLKSLQQEVEDYRLSNGLAAANMLAEIDQADLAANRYSIQTHC